MNHIGRYLAAKNAAEYPVPHETVHRKRLDP